MRTGTESFGARGQVDLQVLYHKDWKSTREIRCLPYRSSSLKRMIKRIVRELGADPAGIDRIFEEA